MPNCREKALARSKSEHGYTLLELLVALTIISLLVGVAVPQVLKYLDRAKFETAKIEISNIGGAIDLFKLDVGRYPSTDEGLKSLSQAVGSMPGWNGPYLKKTSSLVDPWGRPYRYIQPGKRGAYDLYSFGADDTEGGEGVNRDATNW
jgi:general secretion pathway protein G